MPTQKNGCGHLLSMIVVKPCKVVQVSEMPFLWICFEKMRCEVANEQKAILLVVHIKVC